MSAIQALHRSDSLGFNMPRVIPACLESVTIDVQRWLIGLTILAVLLILLYLYRDPLRYWFEGRRISRAARRLGARVFRDVRLPDGMGGEISIDFLVLATDAILVVDVKRYDGLIFGSAQTDEWTQAINSRSYKFPNPDGDLERQISAVRIIVPKTPVRGLHLFGDNAVFPRDKPSNVLQAKDLCRSTRRPSLEDIPPELGAAWTQLTQSLE
jgi:hypothetical protein